MSITFENTPFRRNQTQGHKTLFRKAYALVPGTASTNATAHQPAGWTKTRAWVIAGPAKGFDDTFSHHSVEVLPGGWSSSPEVESGVEAVLFLTKGTLLLTLDDEKHHLEEGGYAYLAPGTDWTIHNPSGEASRFQWVRKAYAPWQGHDADSFVARERDVPPSVQPGTGGIRSTKHFVDPNNLAHDMLVDIVTIQPNGSIPRKRMQWSAASLSCQAALSTGSTMTGCKWMQGTLSGCTPFARRPAMSAARKSSAPSNSKGSTANAA
ncbi:MAG: cupin domain-containing protein [Isosphaeraceae bacterium]